MIVDTEVEVPRPWVMASMIQELGEEDGVEKIFGGMKLVGEDEEKSSDAGDDDEKKKKKAPELKGYIPPPLPKLSAAGAGSITSMIMGSVNMQQTPSSTDEEGNPQEGDNITKEEEIQRAQDLKKLQQSGQQLQSEISQLAIGASIIDKKDGKTIGKIVAPPAPGTTVLLAQMRLDRLGLLGNAQKWNKMNKIMIGDGTREYRYLPYLPLWWPEIDGKTGKEKIVEEKKEEEEELDEL